MNKKVVFLPYDMDTAIGINNEGALVFGYSLEDTDHVGVAEVFNGQSSVLWCNLRDTFGPEIKAMYQNLRAGGNFSYAAVEQAFEEHQAKWPEAIFNEDAFFKYIKPLIEDNDDTYLSMLLGSKAEQRKWWLYNRFRYMDSKYNSGDSLTDRILLRGNAPANIIITPYADIYATIRWASTLKQLRATRNVATTMVCPLDSLGDTDLYVYSAGQLADLGDLSGLMLSFADFHSGTKLSSIVVGSADANYNNVQLRSLNVGNLKLLKKIDARNCSGLGTANDNYAAQKNVDLSGCLGIEEVYFDGTNIGSVTLPNGGFLKKLHLPGTITNLTIQNQTRITEFVCPDFSHITTLFLENTASTVDISAIVPHLAAGCRVRLFNFRWDFQNIAAVHTFLDLFEGMTGMDQNGDNKETPQIYATVHVPTATGDEIESVTNRYPDITVDADVATYYVKYYNWEGDTLLYTETVQKGQNGIYSSSPSHSPTQQYTFSFVGWNTRKNSTTAEAGCRNNIQNNVNLYAAYTTSIRTYTITFVRAAEDGGGTLQTSQVAYGQTPNYTGATPTTTRGAEFPFQGWTPALSVVTHNQTYTAKFAGSNDGLTRGTIARTIRGTIENSDATVIGTNAFAYCTSITEVSFPNVTTIGSSAFYYCYALSTATFPSATAVGASAFYNCSKLTSISIPLVTDIAAYAFMSCSKITALELNNVTSIGANAFSQCTGLTSVSFPNAIYIGLYAFTYCYNLSSVYMPALTTAASGAFQGLSSLTEISLPELNYVFSETFAGCSKLESVYLPKLKTMGAGTFLNCSKLVSIELPSVISLGIDTFKNCQSLETVSLPNVNYISNSAFALCYKLTSVYMPKLSGVRDGAFVNCSAISFISFPSTLSSLGASVFSGCSNLSAIVIPSAARIGISSRTLNNLPSVTFFYVPDNLVSVYQTAGYWSSCASRIKGISELVT